MFKRLSLQNILIILMLIAAVALFVRFGLGGPEDTWICQDGQWVKPGEASGPMQNGACPGELMTVQLFFNNSRFDPEYSCQKTAGVRRQIPENFKDPEKEALESLLAGPNEGELAEQYFTSLPEGVKLNSLKIENGIATADFSQALQEGVGGSCRVSAIRSQITQTLKQFSSVEEVKISINGQTENILQP